ncbi:hypothetical protein PHISCL_00746 [Aspergillus sclerotialis]|uniref:Short chain dehydrogenase n=1 Tax=Aspergillus sclerotialis TaxID=2070753 RepID=A0A3A2ZUU5_9EURO|nr:hypothetical protein PHISCL_00746 [Aspergillus sclerotialis]
MATTPFKSITRLAGTRVLVIGGTSGIGFSVAAAALEHGASVIVASSKATNVESAVSRLKETYPPEYAAKVAGLVCDLGNQTTLDENVVRLLTEATSPSLFFPSGENKGGEKVLLDHIAYTAGDTLAPSTFSLENTTISTVTSSLTVRYFAPIILAKHLSSYMNLTSSSSLTLTSGTNATKPSKGWSVAASIGSAIEGLARGLAVDLAPLRVNTVSPGAVHTELFDRLLGGRKEVLEGALKRMANDTLVEKVARPDEVAEAYVYIMKDGFVDGVILRSDGGRLLK